MQGKMSLRYWKDIKVSCNIFRWKIYFLSLSLFLILFSLEFILWIDLMLGENEFAKMVEVI